MAVNSKSRWADVTEAELAATGKVKRVKSDTVRLAEINEELNRLKWEPPLERARMPQDKPSKYRAVRTKVDGISFHSAKEARRYSELKLLEKAGEVRDLRLQSIWPLYVQTNVAADTPIRIGAYVCDFSYEIADGSLVVEDVKGMKTSLYRWKKKHFEAQYGIEIRET